MNTNPLICVIVPIYNVALYLTRCLDSIVGQTYQNLEIILVDDGSTDHSGQICDQYAQKDKRVKVIHQQNKGVCAARNAGLDHMHGDFVAFVDPDDWLDRNCYQSLMQQQQKTKAALVLCDYYCASDTHLEKRCFSSALALDLDPAQFLLCLLKQRNFSVWNKLYRRDFVGKTRFNPTYKVAEDLDFVFQLAQKGGKVSYVADGLYFYYQRPQSAVRCMDSATWYRTVQMLLKLEKECAPLNSPSLQHEIEERLLALSSVFCMTALLGKQKDFKKLKQIHFLLKTNITKIFTLTTMGVSGKLFAFLFVFFPYFTSWFFALPGVNNRLRKSFVTHVAR